MAIISLADDIYMSSIRLQFELSTVMSQMSFISIIVLSSAHDVVRCLDIIVHWRIKTELIHPNNIEREEYIVYQVAQAPTRIMPAGLEHS